MQRFSVYNLDEVKSKLDPPFKPEGIPVDLAHGEKMRFRIKRNEGDVYFGLVEDGRSAVLHRATGAFNVSD